MKRRDLLLFVFGCCLLFCQCKKKTSAPELEKPPTTTVNHLLVDSLATPETLALFQNLKTLAQKRVLFGHQDDLAYGVGWWAEPGRSDIKDVCGDYPAVIGWDLGDIHLSNNLDGIRFDLMRGYIQDSYANGGINTISLHLDNPVTSNNAWDNATAVKHILPGQTHHTAYLETLKKVAEFLKSLKSANGTSIPVILRPYHEHNQTWSWWGKSACTVEEYNALWKMTVRFLRDTEGLHHLLYAISPQDLLPASNYFERYPGDAWVDIFGLDYYQLWSKTNVVPLGKTLARIAQLAEERGKLAALTETGVENVPFADWWTKFLLPALDYNEYSRKISWCLVWRNGNENHFFAPYPGQSSAADFIQFYQDSLTAFQGDLPDLYR